ncbi:hypothetical protein ACJU26_09045 [Acidithiobacillus sp. M4-SHS-6]|uniref:hypothetical protein n=1 Tax=Acidithiobacillus sp. M4-SHS-6 TaxID=3383024 RepID=UPI0039BE50BA
MLILQAGRWRTPLERRRELARKRVFGGEDAALAFARSLEPIPPKAQDVSLFAFPFGGTWLARFGQSVFWVLYTILIGAFIHFASVGSPSGFFTIVVVLVALCSTPIAIMGFFLAFGNWRVVPDMSYPIAIFLEDLGRYKLYQRT